MSRLWEILRTLGWTADVPKKGLTIRRNLVAIFYHVIFDEPGMTILDEGLGNVVQFLIEDNRTLESVDAMRAITYKMLTLFSLAHTIGTGLSSFVHVRREDSSIVDSRVLQYNKPLDLVAHFFRS